MFDRDMRYLIYSPRWLTDYKLGDQDLVGRSHYDVFPEILEGWKEAHRRCLAGAVEVHEDDSFVRTDGSTEWLRWEVRPWRNARNEIGGIVMFTEMITERKRAEEEHRRLVAQVRVAEALRAVDRRKDEFLAMLSHELRNPLAPIAMAIEIMRLREPTDDSILWARDVIARQTAQLTRLVDDLLDVSRITQGKITLNRSALDLRPIVAQAVEAAQPLLAARHHHLALLELAEYGPMAGVLRPQPGIRARSVRTVPTEPGVGRSRDAGAVRYLDASKRRVARACGGVAASEDRRRREPR